MLRVSPLHLNPRPRSALLLLRPLSVGRFAPLRFRPKNMAGTCLALIGAKLGRPKNFAGF